LLLRQDNADRRLTPKAFELGLVDVARHQRLQEKLQQIERAEQILRAGRILDAPADRYLERPEVTWQTIVGHLPELAAIPAEAALQVEYDVKYAGYIGRQQDEVSKQQRLAARRIPRSFRYDSIKPLRTEAKQKLAKIQPVTLAQARRISGITPADIALVMAHLDGAGCGKSEEN